MAEEIQNAFSHVQTQYLVKIPFVSIMENNLDENDCIYVPQRNLRELSVDGIE